MWKFLKSQYGEYQKNNEVNQGGYIQFIEHITQNILYTSEINISPLSLPKIIIWDAHLDKNNILKFKCKLLRFKLTNFKNFILSHLRNYSVLIILVKIPTGNYIEDQMEIIQLWGYRLILIEKMVILHHIHHKELFNTSGDDVDDIESAATIYCCPDGQINGWEIK